MYHEARNVVLIGVLTLSSSPTCESRLEPDRVLTLVSNPTDGSEGRVRDYPDLRRAALPITPFGKRKRIAASYSRQSQEVPRA